MARFMARYRNRSDGSSVARAFLLQSRIVPNRRKWLKAFREIWLRQRFAVRWDRAVPVPPKLRQFFPNLLIAAKVRVHSAPTPLAMPFSTDFRSGLLSCHARV
jgi:hypothetical protein